MEKGITVLIVDDIELMRETLKMLVSTIESVIVVGEAGNGKEAIDLAKELTPDIILMDINMSPVNGFEATRKILKQNPAAKIIGISMHKRLSYANNIMRLGAKGYVTKSADHNEIIDAIKKVAAGGRYMDKGLEGML